MIGQVNGWPTWASDHPHICLPAVIVMFVVACCVKRRQMEGVVEQALPLATSAIGVWGVGQLFVFAGGHTSEELGPVAWPLAIAGVVALSSIVPGFVTKCWNLWSGPDIETPTRDVDLVQPRPPQ
jgi:hypothetical protein